MRSSGTSARARRAATFSSAEAAAMPARRSPERGGVAFAISSLRLAKLNVVAPRVVRNGMAARLVADDRRRVDRSPCVYKAQARRHVPSGLHTPREPASELVGDSGRDGVEVELLLDAR